ncbi:MAG: DNA repair protein RadC [Anaerolineales bacterium]|nr:DNA repair protein RadC [Anaerolineales bacterium]MCS7246618.1 DNA repair protein RadC [Anaerolineales bacterium]MDW8160427.1 DNA repair protein RadC [Anaerolineales bacterium]MDW8447790.1 DNA repair protein RadC [Anaerolineales bacterium]
MGEPKFTFRIQDLPRTDRPRERLAEKGAGALSNAELLAILIRTGVPGENAVQIGQRLLREFHSILGLHRASFQELSAQHGIGPAKAAQIKAALELGNRLRLEADERPIIRSPEDAFVLVDHEMSGLEQEEMRVLILDTRHRVLAIHSIVRGSLNSAQVRVGEIFRQAVRLNAAAIIVVHNHPSGDPTPSGEDIALTKAIIQAGQLLDIEVLDHIIVGRNRYASLRERGIAFG